MTDSDRGAGGDDAEGEGGDDEAAKESVEGEAADGDAVVLSPETWQRAAPPRTPPIATDPPPTGEAFDDERWYLNRELSEIGFQWRVLHEATDDRQPPLERLRFLSILTRNLDEFFMKRIGGLKQQIDAGTTEPTVDGATPREQWSDALSMAADLFETQSRCYHEAVKPALREAGVEVLDYDDLRPEEVDHLRERFESSVLPTLTPLTFDPAHPFPFLSNLSLSLAVRTRKPDGTVRFSRIKVPENLPRLVPADPQLPEDGETRVVPVERVIAANLDLVFPDVEIVDHSTFRVARNAEVRRNEDVAEGLIERIEDVLRQRRFATLVRIEVDEDTSPAVRDLLVEHLDVDEREVFERRAPLALSDFGSLYELDAPDLKRPAWTPQQHPRFVGLDAKQPEELFEEIRSGDALVHHPYHSFTDTVQTFLDAAAHDPDTLAIKAAIYRTAPDSRVLASLIDAAKNGKQVAVMVELKARFDEENNLRWVKRLEEEGIHVAYGTVDLKTHSKVALAVREEDDDVRLYSHVATGNYHSETAKGYVDLGLFTADHDVGQDLVRLFNSFTGHSRNRSYRKLLVAPETLRERLYDLIDRERDHALAGRGGRIVAKMNALEDPGVVERLYEAAEAGAEIDLIVRGICRLRPGVESVTGSVRVHSVVGRFLEHSRVFRFDNAGDPDYYIGSADWMTRNLDRRVEAVAPVEDPSLRQTLDEVLSTMLDDNRRRWEMRPDGSYVQARPGPDEPSRDTHEVLMRRASERAPDERSGRESEPRRDPSVDLDAVFTSDTDAS
ncbi:polyphosphate kinase 1 [Halorubrum sp. Atlit-8R]|uniref:polyphosphate kinase 1 n=1 Tax=unclassified Halorubrum TaxID=2642239 RepID=UPI000EF28A6E|nr:MULTISPECIES: polyphosphate kinase 1 [unclassified Halorubrum]RLM66824.1 polyphosphate kinase 1 [Halorubrum sp. Atlit-9R]RLM81647.1 polyphosphate kinase 1 [Halorubrum sp. Atlit-8R]